MGLLLVVSMQLLPERARLVRRTETPVRHPATSIRPARQFKLHVAASVSNGNGAAHVQTCPSAAETARTVLAIVNEGALSTIGSDGAPLGTSVSYVLDKEGQPLLQITSGTVEADNLTRDSRCSLLVQPTTYPARALASVTLIGTATPVSEGNAHNTEYRLNLDRCVYHGGLDQASGAQLVTADEFKAAEPDVLRKCAVDLVSTWNNERAEDIYRIVSDFLGVPLEEMVYAELLWMDRLGLYIRSEASGRLPEVVRVPFYRPVIDERDVRSVVTMAAQLAWERTRKYIPPVSSIFEDLNTAASN